MTDLIRIEFEKPVIPEDWNYDESVQKVKTFVYKAKNLNEDILRELYIARDILSKSGCRTDLVANATKLPTWENYCNEIGIDRSTVHRWLKKYLNPIHFSSKSSDWTTPEIIINKTVQLLGEIDLDPCSNPDFPNIPAKNHFTKKEDGLTQNWIGKIYMNPPYGSEIKKWIYHLAEQFEEGNVLEAIALVPSRTDTEWFRRLKKHLRCFIWGRLKFGGKENSAPFPSMVVYLGENEGGFAQIFSDIGDVYISYEST